MIIYLLLFWEFFKTGLFAVGGGLATLPFLYNIASRFDWFTAFDISNMIAIAESTPGPIGVNMATYAGFSAGGIPGAFIATCGLIIPSFLCILIISRFLERFNDSFYVKSAFYGIRPAVAGLIFAIWIGLILNCFFPDGLFVSNIWAHIDYKSILLFLGVFIALQKTNFHPAAFIALSAVLGIAFKF